MTWGKSLLLTIPLALSGILVVAAPASAKDFSATDWRTVSAGGAHACAITNSGYLYCWGNDDHGQLGNTDTFNSKTTPNQVDGSGWTVVSAGGAHTCGIRSGKLYCWGSDGDGQLGNGASSTSPKGKPQQIGSLTDWKTVSAGTSHTCAVRGSSYYLVCWGDDSRGQGGDGATNKTDKSYPKLVAGTYTGWKAVSAGGSHTCGIRTNGKLYCWGDDSRGQLGNGSTGSVHYPYPATASVADWKAISAGGTHTCAIRTNGYLYCWGDDSRGQLGNGSVGSKSYPYRVGTGSGWTQISTGGAHTCGMGSSRIYCWGDNEYGQTVASSEDPLFVSAQLQPDSWKTADAGDRHTCAVKGDGTLNCWGVPEPPPPNDCPTDRPTNVYAGDPWQDLGYWKLTTPVDDNHDGKPDEKKQPDLKTLDGKTYFDRLSSPTRIKFRADVDGATTSGSSFPRSELREMTQDGQYNRAAWSSTCGTHTMTITQAITRLPEVKDEVVAGQIHDQADDVVMIRLEGPRLFVEADGREVGLLDDGYGLGERFTATISATKSGITVTYDNLDSTASNASVQYNPSTNDELWYFKAGCYTQANEFNGTGYGEVVIYGLDVTHSPS